MRLGMLSHARTGTTGHRGASSPLSGPRRLVEREAGVTEVDIERLRAVYGDAALWHGTKRMDAFKVATDMRTLLDAYEAARLEAAIVVEKLRIERTEQNVQRERA